MSNNNFGLNESYDYLEFEFDSKDTSDTMESLPTLTYLTEDLIEKVKLNWPLFNTGRPIEGTIAAMKILEVQIPFSYYIVNPTNNILRVVEFFAPPRNIVVPPGNYTGQTLASTLESLLNNGTSLSPSGTPTVYQVTYNNITGKFKFESHATNASGGGYTIRMNTVANDPRGYYDLGTVLGFFHGDQTPTIVPGPGEYNTELYSTNVAQITGPNYIYVCSNLMGQQMKLHLPKGADNKGQIGPQMAKIPVNVNPGGVIFWQDPDPQKWFNIDELSNFYNIDLYCTLGHIPGKIDFNGLSFSVKLGMLINRTGRIQQGSGLTSEGRVIKRMKGSV